MRIAQSRNFEINVCLGTRLFVKVPQSGDSEGTFRSSNPAAIGATCSNQSYRSKVEATPLSALFKDTTSERAGLSSFFYAERQAEK